MNNAGILRDKAFHNMTPDMFDAVIDVHLRGAFYVTQPAFVHMREQGYGRVVTTSSAAGLYGNFGQTNYSRGQDGPHRPGPHVLATKGRQVQHQGQHHRARGAAPA